MCRGVAGPYISTARYGPLQCDSLLVVDDLNLATGMYGRPTNLQIAKILDNQRILVVFRSPPKLSATCARAL